MKGNEALAALWEALETPYEPPPPNAITAEDVVKKFGIKRRAALDRLYNQVRAGKMETGKFMVNGHRTNYYWMAPPPIKYSGKGRR